MRTRIIENISDIAADTWNACATHAVEGLNPFCSHGFLYALEKSGCATAKTGWLAQHIILEDKDGALLGATPLYLKSHSLGEYVFDQGWANAYEQAGGNYYPKLQSSIPFSPVTSPRLLSSNPAYKELMLKAAINLAKKLSVSSLHFTFLEQDDVNVMKSHHLLKRNDQQYHWINNNYGSFTEFLEALSSRKRKNILKERACFIQDGIEIEWVQASEITEDCWDHYFEFYLNTAQKKWGRAYLNREFFSLLSENIPDNLLLVMAKRNGRYIAGALNLIGDYILYGRYWGAKEHHKFLHFEICYYQAIEFAIKNKLTKVEAGAQGDHKLSRGYIPTATNSMHWIENPSFRNAIENYLDQERTIIGKDMEYLNKLTPFKNSKK
ncbi:MAG: N-acetyltransferase [Kordiimonadaceae bacterium]|nr:N-acetyltransferase [Kordiimonadaceae bacterium]MBT6135230.1 N-acetyltransferase [Kordiimonadaceae bacterium]MBT7604696.1 N-acetyltransferase [Kordiimonadaceae bacterium]MDB4044339.1 GNAT family N-acetyltransferase [Emcibacteraceae bacterium]MDC1428597.1 GNAT family N-acetyltransferase [Emcibacteraceae bacterium]